MNFSSTSAGHSTRPAPRKERAVRPTPQIAAVLAVISVLSNYGRYVAQTIEGGGVGRSFATIARYFGTGVLDTIKAHIYRGMMRAMALERMLKLRAARGRDLQVLALRTGSQMSAKGPEAEAAAKSTPPEALTPEQVAASQAAAEIKAGERLARGIARDEPLTLKNLPRQAVIDAQVLRTPIGRTIEAMCRDFGISALLCDCIFWNAMADSIEWYRGSLGNLVLDTRRREREYQNEEWKHPEFDLPEETRAGARRVLGFSIGETPETSAAGIEDDPADPFEVVGGPGVGVAAVATGPP